MLALRANTYGGTDTLSVEDLPEPAPGAGEVVVEVSAASVNYPDVLICRNEYQISAPLPFTPGSEFAGTVVAVAPEVTTPRVGDRVFGTVMVGAFAQRIVVPAPTCRALPDAVSFETGAAFPVVYETAYHALRSVGELHVGETLAVLGAAGGVGSAAVELGKLMGARVIACASSTAKLDACRSLGADEVIDYATEDLKVRLKELGGADVVIDPVGGQYSEAALRSCNYGSRFVVIGFAAKEIPRIPLNLVLLKGVAIVGFEIGAFISRRGDEANRNRRELLDHVAAGRLRPLIGARYPLGEAAEALRSVFERDAVGKVLILP